MVTTIDETRTTTADGSATADGGTPQAFTPEMKDRVGTSTRTPSWDPGTERRIDDGQTLARGLGWFSIGLGLAEVAAGDRMSRYFGLGNRGALLRLYGLRELGAGVGILRERQPEGWIWARVAGDALDLGTLATGLRRRNPHRGRLLGAIAAVAGVSALDVLCATQLHASADRGAA
jgi:hypothetical protein